MRMQRHQNQPWPWNKRTYSLLGLLNPVAPSHPVTSCETGRVPGDSGLAACAQNIDDGFEPSEKDEDAYFYNIHFNVARYCPAAHAHYVAGSTTGIAGYYEPVIQTDTPLSPALTTKS